MIPNKVYLLSDLIEKNKRVFKVPVYQRNYDWNEVQCKKLYEDIIRAYKRDHKHFLGTIVYIVNRYTSNLEESLIIDGQQRITTMYLLLKAVLDVAQNNNNVRIAEEMNDTMFNRRCDEVNKIKLKPIRIDNEQLTLLIKNKTEDMDRNSNIYKNYVFFKSKIIESIEYGYELSDIVEGIKLLEMVEIVLDKSQGDEPQKIFESINSTGLDLSLADLVRNYLLMDDDNQDELYEDYWRVIEKNVGYKNLGDFVINFLDSKISNSVNKKNAYQLFTCEYAEKNSKSHTDVLTELRQSSKYYGAFIGINTPYSKKITEILRALKLIKQTTAYPLLFKVFDDYELGRITEDELYNVIDYIVTYLIRITTCEYNKNLGKFFKSMYSRVIEDDYENYYEKFASFLNNIKTKDRMPTDSEFKEALVYKPLYKKPACKFILASIENMTKEKLDATDLTIEHILPQKENAVAWKREIGENYAEVYEKYLHTIGNLTITGYNSDLGTRPFDEKKKIIKENSKANILNEYVLSASVWNEKSILTRASKLADKVAEIFDYVSVNIDLSEDDNVFSIDDNINLTGSVPVYLEFLKERIAVDSWAGALSAFMDAMYDLDRDLMSEMAVENFSIPYAENTYISNDSRVFRKAKQISESGIYYESNLSANGVISFVKAILSHAEIDYNEFAYCLKEVPFDINNEGTWAIGKISTAKLFYSLIDDLIANNKISSDEIELLKTKEYTKKLFDATDYPALANNRDDNKGNSNHIRYRKIPLSFCNKDIYVGTQFFEDNREDIINWYKDH